VKVSEQKTVSFQPIGVDEQMFRDYIRSQDDWSMYFDQQNYRFNDEFWPYERFTCL